METFFSILSWIAMGAVLVILIMGLVNMMRNGDANLSQRLMRLRVIAQAVAIGLVLLVLAVSGSGA